MGGDKVIAEQFGGTEVLLRRGIAVVFGMIFLTVASKIQVPLWPSPVPVSMATLAVLMLGAAYGPGLGVTTILAWLGIGALGYDVFAGSSGERSGIAYMLSGTGGYLIGYVLAVFALGTAARHGLDRTVAGMVAALLVGNVLIYLPGLLWLHQMSSGWEQTLAWGLTPFLVGDALKLMLAALLVPGLWRFLGDSRA